MYLYKKSTDTKTPDNWQIFDDSNIDTLNEHGEIIESFIDNETITSAATHKKDDDDDDDYFPYAGYYTDDNNDSSSDDYDDTSENNDSDIDHDSSSSGSSSGSDSDDDDNENKIKKSKTKSIDRELEILSYQERDISITDIINASVTKVTASATAAAAATGTKRRYCTTATSPAALQREKNRKLKLINKNGKFKFLDDKISRIMCVFCAKVTTLKLIFVDPEKITVPGCLHCLSALNEMNMDVNILISRIQNEIRAPICFQLKNKNANRVFIEDDLLPSTRTRRNYNRIARAAGPKRKRKQLQKKVSSPLTPPKIKNISAEICLSDSSDSCLVQN